MDFLREREGLESMGRPYRIPGGELLLRTDDGSTSLRSVESGFATDDGLFLRGSASDFAADFGDGIPVVHDVVEDLNLMGIGG